jgi:hypothetical protein
MMGYGCIRLTFGHFRISGGVTSFWALSIPPALLSQKSQKYFFKTFIIFFKTILHNGILIGEAKEKVLMQI